MTEIERKRLIRKMQSANRRRLKAKLPWHQIETAAGISEQTRKNWRRGLVNPDAHKWQAFWAALERLAPQ